MIELAIALFEFVIKVIGVIAFIQATYLYFAKKELPDNYDVMIILILLLS